MKIMMLSAGEGTRFRPQTNLLPKPALPFLNLPLWTYPLFLAKDYLSHGVVFNTFHLPELMKKSIRKKLDGFIPFEFSDEVGNILGGAGGLRRAQEFFKNEDVILLMNGDEVFLPDRDGVLEAALEEHLSQNALATLLVVEHSGVGTKYGGVWTQNNHQIVDFGKKQKPEGVVGWHFVGHLFLSKRIFDWIPQCGASNILYDVLLPAIKKGEQVIAYPSSGIWFETGNLQDYLGATQGCLRILRSGAPATYKYRRGLEEQFDFFKSPDYEVKNLAVSESQLSLAGAYLPACLTGQNETPCGLIAKSAQISPRSEVKGYCVIGPDARVDDNVLIENAVLGAGVYLQNGSTVILDLLL